MKRIGVGMAIPLVAAFGCLAPAALAQEAVIRVEEVARGQEPACGVYRVVEMRDLALPGDSLRFTIEVAEEEYFARPISLRFRGAEQVPGHLNEPWGQTIRGEPRRYRGVVHPDSIVLDVDGHQRVFCRMEGSRGREVVLGMRK